MKKKSMKKTAVIAAAAVLAFAATACGSSASETTAAGSAAETSGAETSESKDAAASEDAGAEKSEKAAEGEAAKADGKTYKIGVLQFVQHNALDLSNEGFVEALDESGIQYEIDQQNAAGETATCTTIAQKFVNDGDDLIFAIATPAAQAASAETADIPIVLTAVTDPADSGLVEDNEKPGANVTGSSDLTPVAEQIKLLKQLLPDAKKVGVLYCSAESNSEIQAQLAHTACEAEGLEAVDYTVSTSNDIQTVVESMVGNVDAIYAPTDNVIAAGMPTVSMIASENKLPVICGEQGMVDNGGLATYSIDYKELGKLAGQMAVEILTEGKNPAEMPIEYYPTDKLQLVINDEAAEQLGIDVSAVKADGIAAE